MEMMRQITVLQEELTRNTKLEILVERGGNKPTSSTASKNPRTPLKP